MVSRCTLSAADGGDPVAAARRLSESGHAQAAMACYERALRANPDPLIYYENAAVAHAVGDSQAIERSLRAALRIAPFFGEGYFELGNTLYSAARNA
eukprot:3712172-Prymnesium_polylepis.1